MTKHWKRCLQHLAWILFCLAICYWVNDIPFLTRGQAIHYHLAQNLATQYEPLESFKGEGSSQIHLYHNGANMATFRTELNSGGLFPAWYATRMICYPQKDGLSVVPLYVSFDNPDVSCVLHMAVTCFNPAVATVDLVVTNLDGTTKTIPTHQEKMGLYLADCPDYMNVDEGSFFDWSNYPLYENDRISAVAYDHQGEIIAKKSHIWSDNT